MNQMIESLMCMFAFRFHGKFPDHIAAFDIVSEEDQGHSHLYFLHVFLTANDLPLTFHAGETK